MGLFDKLKDGASAAAEQAKKAAEQAKKVAEEAKAEREAKKAAEEQHRQEMNALAAIKSKEITDAIFEYKNSGSFFDNVTKEELLAFTKDFYDKIFMPANSVSNSNVQMYPYITDKMLAKISKTWPSYNVAETALVHLKSEGRQEFLITDSSLYFSLRLAEDSNFSVTGSVSCDEISKFSIVKNGETFEFKCDEYVLATFTANKSTTEDFITLDNYFTCIINHDFVITDEEVDRLIQEKIGAKIYAEVKKYMVYDDELLVYFAWGLDSLSAKDYIVCTNKQIIRIDREMFGSTANIKQFYYEDIVSASTEQNSNSTSLTGALLDAAITAATQTCDLIISTAGAGMKISSLYKTEAERIVAVYHHYKKETKKAASQPQVIVQQQQIDPVEQLEKLSNLKDKGIITEEEFAAKKAELLAKL